MTGATRRGTNRLVELLVNRDRVRVVHCGQRVAFEAVSDVLSGLADVEDVPEDRESLARALPGAHAYVATLKVRLDRALIEAAPQLRFVASPTTGSDHIDLAALSERGIGFACLKGETPFLRTITPTAELAFLHVLAASRHFRAAVAQPLAGEWDSRRVAGATLYGKTLGIVGVGRLGSWMARYGQAFGMTVLGCDPVATDWPDGVERLDLHGLLSRADIVTLHVHLSDETRKMIGAPQLAVMKPTAILVNTSRGAIVDEAAVLAALEAGRLGHYGCDVLEGETDGPIADHPIVRYAHRHSNVLITPHMGGVSPDALRRTAGFMAQKVAEFLRS